MEHLLFKEKKESKMMKKKMMITSTTTTTKLPPTQSIPTLKPLKLYHNPIFTHHPPHPQPPPYDYHHRRHCHQQQCFKMKNTELESARAQIMELKAELELERKLRKHVESVAKKMAKELAEERRNRESAERLCDKLEIWVSHHKGEIERIEREREKERRMLRIAEVIREERVQKNLKMPSCFMKRRWSK